MWKNLTDFVQNFGDAVNSIMLGRFRNALYSAMGTPEAGETGSPTVTDLRSRIDSVNGTSNKKVKYAYQRPIFLQLFTEDEIQVTADHMVIFLT